MKSPAVAALITALAYAVLLVQLLQVRGGDVSRFVVAGGGGVDPRRVPPGLTIIPGIGGYDGVVFYRLALDPFTREVTAFGITLDNPPYRQQRIGYPLLVWALSFGRPLLVPRLLVAVNLAALIAMAAIGGLLSRQYGYHPFWGLIFPAFPGFVMSLSRDLSEIVASTFALAAIAAIARRRFGWAAAALSYAVLTRETTLIVAIALAAAWAFDRVRKREPRLLPVVFVAPAVTFVVWQTILGFVWGSPPIRAGAPHWTVPFVEYARFFAAASSRRLHSQRVYFAECVFLAAILIVVVLIWRRSRAPLEWRLAWLGALALGATLHHPAWLEDFGFLRIVAEYHVLAGVLILAAPSAIARWAVLLMTIGIWSYVADWVLLLG